VSADFRELIRRVEDMIVRQEILIAEIIAGDRDPADAFQLL
jgi:hypothetical protein